jgi:hypothetical protein
VCIRENYKPLVEDVIMPIVGLLTGGGFHSKNSLDGGHYDTFDAAKEVGLPLSPMVIYCRRLLILLLLHCLFLILRAAEK